MQYNVAQLLKEHTGAARTYDVNEDIRHLAGADMTVEAPLTGTVTLLKDTEGILVTGELETTVGVPCARCLEPVVVPVALEIEEQFFPTLDVLSGRRLPTPPDADPETLIDGHHILDLTEVVRQTLVLAPPMQPVHPDGCVPLADEDAAESEATSDPRWAALDALRERGEGADGDD